MPLEAIRRALPGAVQAGDRWHLWHGLAEAAQKEVTAHSSCWAPAGPPRRDGKHAETTAERWRQVHDLLGKGTGLLECSRRLGLSLNTVKRYARAAEPERMVRAPRYRATLVDPYRDHLRKRRAEDPAVPVQQLLREIRELGYQGSSNLLVRYITQGRVESDRPRSRPSRCRRLAARSLDHDASGVGRGLGRWPLAVEDHVAEVDSVGQDASERSEAEVEHLVSGELVGLEPVDADGTDERQPSVKGRGGHLS